MIITIKDKEFNSTDITQLYPAAIVKTGFEDETTQVSLEWLEVEAKGKVDVVGFGIFIHFNKDDKFTFMFDTKDEMDSEIAKIASQISKK